MDQLSSFKSNLVIQNLIELYNTYALPRLTKQNQKIGISAAVAISLIYFLDRLSKPVIVSRFLLPTSNPTIFTKKTNDGQWKNSTNVDGRFEDRSELFRYSLLHLSRSSLKLLQI